MEVNDAESSLNRLKEELDKAEMLKKQVMSKNGVASARPDPEVFRCEDVEKEQMRGEVIKSEPCNEDLMEIKTDELKVEENMSESVKAEDNSPLNVVHHHIMEQVRSFCGSL